MSKKVFIGVGHGGSDPGAVKYFVEKEYTLKVAYALSEILSKNGVDFKLSRTQDVDTEMNSKVKMCNDYNPDLVIDIHFNAGGGHGFEVYYSHVGGTSKTLANNINTEVKKIMSSRGTKTKLGDGGSDYFAIIRETNAPAVLCEGGFVDNWTDSEFIKSNYKKLAEAYAQGILKTLGIKSTSGTTNSKPTSKPSNTVDRLYRIRKTWSNLKSQIGAYKDLENAKKACKSGYTVFDWNGKAVYSKKSSATVSLKIGDKVRVKSGSKDYNGNSLASFVYKTTYKVMEVDKNRIVIGLNGSVTAAVHKDNLTKV